MHIIIDVFRTWLLRHLYNKDAPMIALEFLIVHHNYLREDREIVSLILQRDGLSLEHAAEDLKNDEALVDVAVRQHGKSLLYAHERFRNDESMIALAFKTYPRIVKSMSDDLKRNKRFVSSLMDSNPGAIEYLDKRNRSDKDLMLQVCKKGGVELLRCASSALKSDKDFAKDVIEYDLDGSGFVRGSHDIFETMTLTDLVQGESTYRWLLSHCPEDKKEIMYTALHRDPWVYLSLPEHTRCMPAVMMHAFSQDWSRFIPNMMRKLDQYHKAQSGLGFSFTGLSVPPLYHYVANRLLSELIPKCRDFIAAERKKHGNSFHNPYRLLRELLSDVLRNQQVLLKNSCLPLNGHLTELNFCKYSDLFFGLQIPLNAILEGVALGISSTVVSIGCLSLSILRYLNTYEMIDLLKSLSLNHNFQRYVVDRSVAKSDVTYRRPLVSLFSQSAGVGSHTGKRSLDVVVATRDSMQELGSADSRRGKRCKIESAGSALSNQSGLSL